MDGENQIYWLVFGIGDSENDASWEWYLIILIDSIGNIKDLVLISDLNGSIKKSVATIFLDASHDIWIYHLGQNLRSNFKKVYIHKIFVYAVKLYRVAQFDIVMTEKERINANIA